ncbi:MAG: hypothetical protein NTX54_09550 [Chloroflexi bacterium]|nr:hypothetical protein [Chloroflexota bacterium]
MTSPLVKTGASLFGTQVIGRSLGVALGSGLGRRVFERFDRQVLSPFEHREVASRWAGSIGGHVADIAVNAAGLRNPTTHTNAHLQVSKMASAQPTRDWAELIQRAATILMAIGAIVKVVTTLMEERSKVADEHASWRGSSR